MVVWGLGEEVARKNYPSVETFKKRRRIKQRGGGVGGVAKRKSRRVVGDDVVKEIPKIVTKSLRQLLMKGGPGGEIKEGLTTEWDYFPREYNKMTTGNRLIVHTLAEREKRNKTAFTSVRWEIKDDTFEVED